MLDPFGGPTRRRKPAGPDAGEGAIAGASVKVPDRGAGIPVAPEVGVPADVPASTGDPASRDRSTRADARASFDALTETIWRLRQPDGCPWDRVQTHESIGKNMIEEAYEALDCIESGDVRHLREELGDVLMQVMLHAQIAADAHEFTIDDVVRDLNEKLIRRHPHVFGGRTAVRDAGEVLGIWDEVKREERAGRAGGDVATGQVPDAEDGPGARPEGLLDSVPAGMPALMQAQKVSKRAAKAGFEWETVEDVWEQVASERAEFEREPAGSAAREVEFGDLLFALVNVARKEGIDAEGALRASTKKFRRRWAAIEEAADFAGIPVENLSTEQLNAMWDAVKEAERAEAADV